MTASAVPARHSVYTGRATNWPMVVLTITLALPLLATANAAPTWQAWTAPLLIVTTGAVLNLVTATNIRTTAGPNGVTVRFGLLSWPRSTYRLMEITQAEVFDLPPWRVSYGFWWTPTHTNCTVRSGPTLRLTLTTGRTVTITVPNPHAAVTAIREAHQA